ncbi:MAG: diphthine synthase [Candidatus Bathyarchaeia archaeon]
MLTFVGLGLQNKYGITLKGLNEARKADIVFAEFYTSIMPGFKVKDFEKLIKKPIKILNRKEVEEKAEGIILKPAKNKHVVFLVPGDPMVATTHVDLRLRAEKAGIKTKIIHGVSIISAIPGITGLQSYKFGRTITMPTLNGKEPYISPYEYILKNLSIGLHSLILLDIDLERKKYLKIHEALKQLLSIEEKLKKRIINEEGLVIGIARAGSKNSIVKADEIKNLLNYDFGNPPYSLVFPASLHFMEIDALTVFAKAKRSLLEKHQKSLEMLKNLF